MARYLRDHRAVTLASVGAAAILLLAGAQRFRVHYLLGQAEAELLKGFQALAAETLDPVRGELTSSPRGCQALVAAYFGAHKADRLEWASQACLSSEVKIVDTYLGLAASRQLTHRDDEALSMLQDIARKFEKSPDPYFRMAQIYRRNKKDAEAADAIMKAAELAPQNNQLTMDAVTQLSAVERWADARHLADRIKSVPTDIPEVKLVLARALFKGGDREGAQVLITQARAMLNKTPGDKSTTEHAITDLLTSGGKQPGSRGLASPPGLGAVNAGVPATPPRPF